MCGNTCRSLLNCGPHLMPHVMRSICKRSNRRSAAATALTPSVSAVPISEKVPPHVVRCSHDESLEFDMHGCVQRRAASYDGRTNVVRRRTMSSDGVQRSYERRPALLVRTSYELLQLWERRLTQGAVGLMRVCSSRNKGSTAVSASRDGPVSIRR